MQPTEEELKHAFWAGFQSIDDGDTFYLGFDAYLARVGYQKNENASRTCADSGRHGHLPECRWVKF